MYDTKLKVTYKDSNIGSTAHIAPSTHLPKSEAPLWRYTQGTIVYGFVYDWDHLTFPDNLDPSIHYLYHQTHSNKWRIIVPFKEPITFKSKDQYHYAYRENAALLGLIGYDTTRSSIVSWFFYRPSQHLLRENSGISYEPIFDNIASFKSGLKIGIPKIAKTSYQALSVFRKIHALHKGGKYLVNYSLVRSSDCLLHPAKKGDPINGVQYNDARHSNAGYIKSHHEKCLLLLTDYFDELLQSLDEKSSLRPILSKTIAQTLLGVREDFTILYLTLALIKGKLALGAVLACYINKNLHGNMLDLDNYDLGAPKVPSLLASIIYDGNIISQNKLFYEYTGTHYRQIDKDDLKAILTNTLAEYVYYKSYAKPTWRRHLSDIVSDMVMLSYGDTKPTQCLALQNKVLFFTKGIVETREPSPSHFVTNLQQYLYNPKAKCPLWTRSLTEWLGSQAKIDVLQEWAGYCLTEDRHMEKFLFMYGIEGAGKGTIGETLSKLTRGTPLTLDGLADESQYQHLTSRYLAFVDEAIDSGDKKTLELIKKLTSTGDVSWRVMYSQMVMVSKHFPKLMMTANSPEKVFKNLDGAMQRRMIALEFNKRIDKTNPRLKEQLSEELPGILNWAIVGYKRLYKNDRFSPYNDLTNLAALVNSESLDFQATILDLIQDKPGHWFQATYLHQLYERNTIGFMTRTKFGLMMNSAFVTSPDRKRQKNNRMCYLLRQGGDEIYEEPRDITDRIHL